jgi:uncharacterized membrane protein
VSVLLPTPPRQTAPEPPPGAPPPAPPVVRPAPPRVRAIDWFRGLAVILMMEWHVFDAWLLPEAKVGWSWWFIRHMGGLPSRLFLFLAGVSAALRFESQLARGIESRLMRAQLARRGLQIVGFAYLFRLQEHLLAGFKGGWAMLFKVDILNAIGASLLLVAGVATPRRGRPQILVTVLAAAVFLGLGPLIGPAHFPQWLPRPLTSYLGGQRPMSWFPIFPWGAWALAGTAVGHLWVRHSGTERGAARIFLLTALVGVLTTATVILIRAINPYIIRYPSELVQQMGPGSFFFRLGVIGALAGLSYLVTRLWRGGFSWVTQLGQTSLFVYWIHVDLCYGGISKPLRAKLTLPQAVLALAGLVLLMLGASLLWARWKGQVKAWRAARAGGAAVSSSAGARGMRA